MAIVEQQLKQHFGHQDSGPEDYMQQALELARCAEGRTAPNPPVGAVIVKEGVVVGSGFHPKAGEPHAEIFALRAAGEQACGADIYVTLEPCSHHGRTGPCCDALIAAGVARVFVGIQDPNPQVSGRGISRLRAAGIFVKVGVCAVECRRLVAPFIKWITHKQPFMILKAAMTLDGRIATSSGESQWITNEHSRQYTHQLRDKVDAIMVGVGTVVRDNPRLTTRLPNTGRDPLRIVIDSTLRTPVDAAIVNLSSAAKTIIFTTGLADQKKIAAMQKMPMVEVVQMPSRSQKVDLSAVMDYLAEHAVQTVLVEGGAELNMALFNAKYIDRVMFFFAPKLFGGDDGKAMFSGQGVSRLADALHVTDVRTTCFAGDVLIEGEVVSCLPV
ncbi:MAG: bifunctional diaminohydroxyphosphoribosylaminopyrimidine deaminase/5-amino-6-(5-phosphoribosylamino)uracil reductase RibD [Desulfuromonas sp.]|nr:bifunctional diaminohydroxyphosphoribosylaminopyrimidine deaminase/5-amino-6-(5-phosphoribosylamino)uracil reductase RibD [Desulfuromonas sp.]